MLEDLLEVVMERTLENIRQVGAALGVDGLEKKKSAAAGHKASMCGIMRGRTCKTTERKQTDLLMAEEPGRSLGIHLIEVSKGLRTSS